MFSGKWPHHELRASASQCSEHTPTFHPRLANRWVSAIALFLAADHSDLAFDVVRVPSIMAVVSVKGVYASAPRGEGHGHARRRDQHPTYRESWSRQGDHRGDSTLR